MVFFYNFFFFFKYFNPTPRRTSWSSTKKVRATQNIIKDKMTGRVDILGHIFEKIAQKLKNEVTGRKNKKNIQGCLKSKFNITLSYKIVLFFCSSGFHNLNCNSLPIMSLQTLYCNASRESNPDSAVYWLTIQYVQLLNYAFIVYVTPEVHLSHLYI